MGKLQHTNTERGGEERSRTMGADIFPHKIKLTGLFALRVRDLFVTPARLRFARHARARADSTGRMARIKTMDSRQFLQTPDDILTHTALTHPDLNFRHNWPGPPMHI